MQSGHIDKPVTSWTPNGKKVDKDTHAVIVVVCDMDNNKIQWQINGIVHA